MKRILIATDGPPSADAAIAAGLKLAREQSADVVFAHVAGSGPRGPAAGPRRAELRTGACG
jgi:nucleotide-binding universal stress UspA family protein